MNKQDLGLSKNLGTLKKESNNNEKSNSKVNKNVNWNGLSNKFVRKLKTKDIDIPKKSRNLPKNL